MEVPDHPRPPDETPFRRRADGSTDRVVELLRSDPRVWNRDEIYTAFRARKWTDDWTDPEAAIRMALKRAAQQGAITQVTPDSYRAKRRIRVRPVGGGQADANA
jgi:hypothetical protein